MKYEEALRKLIDCGFKRDINGKPAQTGTPPTEAVVVLMEKVTSLEHRLEDLRRTYAHLVEDEAKALDEARDATAKIREARREAKENERVRRLAVENNLRITKLIRHALPENCAEGCGLDGMVQSLLAEVARARSNTQEK